MFMIIMVMVFQETRNYECVTTIQCKILVSKLPCEILDFGGTSNCLYLSNFMQCIRIIFIFREK